MSTPQEGLDAEYAFLVLKKKDGSIAVGNFDDKGTDRQPTVDDIYSAVSIVKRDLEANQVIGSVMGILQQIAGGPQTDSGIIVPKPNKKFASVKRID